ncbi:MAG: pyridoxamine 5'-phosphate oxidase family protein [Porticoccaceae bacterium]
MSSDQPFWELLQSESVLTLATADTIGSWSAPVLYATCYIEEKPVLYFLSSDSSRHIKNLPTNGAAAASVYSSYQGDWQAIKGLQMQGVINEVDQSQTLHWQSIYFARFPEVAEMINNPTTEQQQKIASAFERSGKFSFTPSLIKLTDNSGRFAERNQWTFD